MLVVVAFKLTVEVSATVMYEVEDTLLVVVPRLVKPEVDVRR